MMTEESTYDIHKEMEKRKKEMKTDALETETKSKRVILLRKEKKTGKKWNKNIKSHAAILWDD